MLLQVWDTGVGLESSELATVFNIYSRAKNTYKHTEGMGIGLSIVKNITKLLGHPVTVKSVLK